MPSDRGRFHASTFAPRHCRWRWRIGVGDRHARPAGTEKPADVRELRRVARPVPRAGVHADDVRAVVLTGAGGNFCSGGDVHEIIGPLVAHAAAPATCRGCCDFTRMTGDVVKAMRACPQPIVAAIDGVCAGAGAILAMASDLRLGTARSKVAFLFTRVGLAGADMGACNILPRIIGAGRAAELLFTGRAMDGAEARALGILQPAVRAGGAAGARRRRWLPRSASGPTFAHAMTKTLHASGMEHGHRRCDRGGGAGAGDLHADRGFRAAPIDAFAAKQRPVFEGN